jgi:hypothetical protein
MVAHPVSLQQVLPGVSPSPASASFITDNAIAPYLVAGVLSGSAVRLYQYLKRHANRRAGTEHCDRSYDTIAKELELSRRMVVYAERELEDQGLLHKAAWQGRHRTNRYTFHTPTTPTPGLQKPWHRKRRRPLGAPVESATDCTFTPASESAMDCTLEVQGVALSKVQSVAPIQDVSFKTPSQKGGEAQHGGGTLGDPPALVGSQSPPPPEREISTSQEKTTPASTPAEVPPGWTAPTLKGRARELWQAWQDICVPEGLPSAAWTSDLERAISAALRKYPDFEPWEQALNLIATAPYFKSRKAQGWENTLHWLVKGDHVYQVITGYQTRRQVG